MMQNHDSSAFAEVLMFLLGQMKSKKDDLINLVFTIDIYKKWGLRNQRSDKTAMKQQHDFLSILSASRNCRQLPQDPLHQDPLPLSVDNISHEGNTDNEEISTFPCDEDHDSMSSEEDINRSIADLDFFAYGVIKIL